MSFYGCLHKTKYEYLISFCIESKNIYQKDKLYEVSDIKECLKNIKKKKYNKYVSNTDKIIESIEEFIERN